MLPRLSCLPFCPTPDVDVCLFPWPPSLLSSPCGLLLQVYPSPPAPLPTYPPQPPRPQPPQPAEPPAGLAPPVVSSQRPLGVAGASLSLGQPGGPAPGFSHSGPGVMGQPGPPPPQPAGHVAGQQGLPIPPVRAREGHAARRYLCTFLLRTPKCTRQLAFYCHCVLTDADAMFLKTKAT
jgi:hypothetical protein